MATTTGIKFYAGSYGRSTSLTKATGGAIVFDKNTHSLFVDGVQFGGNIADATFANNILTITKADGTSLQLNFSDLATTSSVMAVFREIKDELDNIETAIGNVDGSDAGWQGYSGTNYLNGATSLSNADTLLDTQIKSLSDTVSNAVSDVKINTISIKSNGVADIAVDGTYNASTNKVASVSTVTGAINNLNVSTDTGAASISGSTITINAVQQENGLIKDGGTTTINLDGTYDASSNKIATQSTVSDAIGGLDTQTDVQAVAYTAASGNDGAKLTFKGVSETDGVIAQGTGATELQFAKVATTGAAEDVSIADSGNLITAMTVEGALAEIAGEIDGMDLTATALMTQTDDTTNGNSTFTISGIQETDGVVTLASGNNASFKTDGVYNASTNLIATQSTVTTAIQNALDSEVTFQGVTSTLPSNPTNGDMYKASAAISIPQASAGQGAAVTTKAGDTIIYKNVSGASDNGWYVIPSGDESFDDTWRAINVNGTKVLGSGISTGDVDFVNGTLTTVSANNGAISVNHATPTAASNNLAALKFQVDSYGHVVGTSALTIGDLGGLASVSHGTDGDYVTVTVGTKDSNNTQAISAAVTVQNVSTASSSAMGLAEASDVKDYVDTKVGTAIQSVDGSTAEKAKSVTQSDYATVKVTATTDSDNDVELDSAVGLTIQSVSTASASAMGLAEASNVKAYVDAHTASVTNNSATIPVNDSNATTLATVDGTNITASVSFYWEEYS